MTTIRIAATPDDVDAAARRAHAAYRSAADAPEPRASWLAAVAAGLRENAAELVEIAMSETHLGRQRLEGELRRTAFQLELFADEVRAGVTLDATIDHADETWGMGPRPDIRRVNVPLGVVGASVRPTSRSRSASSEATALPHSQRERRPPQDPQRTPRPGHPYRRHRGGRTRRAGPPTDSSKSLTVAMPQRHSSIIRW